MKRYGLKGINDEETTCCVCGKIELRRVMWLVELNEEGEEIGEPFHCGTTCGAKLMGYKISKVNTAVKNYAAKVYNLRYAMQCQKEKELGYHDMITTLNKETKTFEERKAHPLWEKVKETGRIAQEWAESQEVIVPL